MTRVYKQRRPWTSDEREILADLYPDVPGKDVAALLGRDVGSVYQQANAMGLRKSAYFLASDMATRIKRGKQLPSMIASRFKPGLVPWNKGLKGWAAPGTESTRFKPGNLSGNAANQKMPVGSHRINADGYLDRKVSDTGYGPCDWQAVHRLVWQAAHGAIPNGHVICFLPGRKSTVLEHITLDALECISRGELAQRNHPRRSSPELAQLVQLKGAITRQVNRISRASAESTRQTA